MFKLKNKLMAGGGMGGGGGMNGNCNMGGMGNEQFTYRMPNQSQFEAKVTPDIIFNRTVYMCGTITMDPIPALGRGTVDITVWGFDGDNQDGNGQTLDSSYTSAFPSIPMRVTQGQIAHTVLNVGMMLTHTVHHHGIEPDYRSDGVGHDSWDVNGQYTYQWKPSHAGTFFYHCHSNTVLHVEMGMYGALIVDPPEGPGTAYEKGPTYDVEAIWAVDEIDPNWHTHHWTDGMAIGDPNDTIRHHDLNPEYFIISGVDGRESASTDPRVAVTMSVGQTLLIRYIHAGYMPQEADFGGLDVKIIASDGRPLRKADGTPSPEALVNGKLETVSAERYDILYTATAADKGANVVQFNINDWITTKTIGTAKTVITVV